MFALFLKKTDPDKIEQVTLQIFVINFINYIHGKHDKSYIYTFWKVALLQNILKCDHFAPKYNHHTVKLLKTIYCVLP